MQLTRCGHHAHSLREHCDDGGPLKEAIASTTDSRDLAKEDTGIRAAKLSDEDLKLKEEAEQTIAAEDSKGKPITTAKSATPDDGKPKRKPPTLLRKDEKPAE